MRQTYRLRSGEPRARPVYVTASLLRDMIQRSAPLVPVHTRCTVLMANILAPFLHTWGTHFVCTHDSPAASKLVSIRY